MRCTVMFVVMALSTAACAREVSQIKFDDPHGLHRAMALGDRAAVATGLEGTGANATMRELADAMLDGRPQRVAAAAEQCVDRSFAAGVLETSIYCNQILAHLALSRGDLHGWSRRLLWARDVGLPELQKKLALASQPALGRGLDGFDFAAIEALPPMTEHDADLKNVLAVKRHPLPPGWTPSIEIQINGHPVEAMIDTGSDVSLLLNEAAAQRIGVRAIGNSLELMGGIPSSDSSRRHESIVIVDRLKFGSASFDHLGAVASSGFIIPGVDAAIGLPMLRRYAGVVFNAHEIALTPKRVDCSPTTPLTFGSTPESIGYIVLPAEVNGRPIRARLDTGLGGTVHLLGQPSTFAATPVDIVEQITVRTATNSFPATRATGTAKIGVLGIELGSRTTYFFPSRTNEFPAWLGTSLFDDHTLTVAFDQQSACLRRSPNRRS